MKKECWTCKVIKGVDEFHKDKSKKDGCASRCKRCVRLYQKEYNSLNKSVISEKQKKYYQNNKERIKKRVQCYRERNTKITRERCKLYYQANKEELCRKNKVNYEKNKKKYFRTAQKRYHSDIQCRLSLNLRRRVSKMIRRGQKAGSAVRDLGCSVQELKQYLELQFQEGVSWGNYGLYGWHVDHIRPLSRFDLTDRAQFLEACHYTNLQPLWAKENLAKHNKVLY